MWLASRSLATPVLFNRPVVGKTVLLRQKSKQTHYYYRIATNHTKAYQYLLLYLSASETPGLR